MNQPLFSRVALPGRLLYWLFLASAVEVPVWCLQAPSVCPPLFSVGLIPALFSRGAVPLASWWPPLLAALILLLLLFLQEELRCLGIKLTGKVSRQQTSESYKLSKEDLLAFSPSPCLVPQREGRAEWGRQKSLEGWCSPFREGSVFVCFVIAYLSDLLGLVKVKIPCFPSLLFLLKPFNLMEMNCVFTLFYREQYKPVCKWSHENSLGTGCVLCVRCRFSFNQWTDGHTQDLESQLFPGRFCGFLRDFKESFPLPCLGYLGRALTCINSHICMCRSIRTAL